MADTLTEIETYAQDVATFSQDIANDFQAISSTFPTLPANFQAALASANEHASGAATKQKRRPDLSHLCRRIDHVFHPNQD